MSQDQTIAAPICHFPTTVVLVDDNAGYLSKIVMKLDKKDTAYKTFSEPTQAYAYLKENAKYPDFLSRCVSHDMETARGHRNIDINLYPIREEIYNPKRFEQISVLVIDQEMPGLKGLEICESLKNTPIKKILLTGEVDESRAIDAFNKGIIDQFISKNADDFYNRVNSAIQEQKLKFMEEATASISNGLTHFRDVYGPSCLIDPVFISKLNDIVKENNICEYYLSDDNGSYIFLDVTGKPSWLVLKNSDEMEADYYLAEDCDNQPSKEIIDGLKNKKLIVHLFTKEEERSVFAGDWQSHGLLFPAKELKGKNETYYYAYINDPKVHDINQDSILSFRKYQEKVV